MYVCGLNFSHDVLSVLSITLNVNVYIVQEQ
jgi:hypothetical protein